jgi:primosomal protein N' (replication factor Y) (superfamily II helicase)
MTADAPVWRIAIPAPVYQLFDYLAPAHIDRTPHAGARVRVPFGRGSRTGVIAATAPGSGLAAGRLKRVAELLDDTPLLTPDLMKLLWWTADYYHAPPGEVIIGALPVLLRRGDPARGRIRMRWRLTDAGRELDNDALACAPRQQGLHRLLARHPEGIDAGELVDIPGARAALRALRDKGRVIAEEIVDDHRPDPAIETAQPGPMLNPAQHDAVAAVLGSADAFQTFLLDGVTGSGKTEVYFGIIRAMLHRQCQILLLVPEIGLTPQLVDRVRGRFDCPLSVLHSGLSDRERLDAWLKARDGHARIVIGTRSAVLTPLPALGAIIVDEEHDSSYKQQEGIRWHARDLAIMRARQLAIPVVLGSATPSLESLHNCRQGRYRDLLLPTRAGSAAQPAIRLVDLRTQPVEHGLTARLADAIGTHLAGGRQVLLFLNRRGYAPTLMCQECGWIADCRRCDAHMILHQARRLLRCHHCDAQTPVMTHCPRCGNPDLRPLGQGTERIEETLTQRFPQAEILRIDRDSTRRKGSMDALMQRIRNGRRQILVGTQMLAKGHHFPNVTLAGILDADSGLFGADFRAGERMGQLIVQVAGRAGRADQPGEVLIQTRYPEHPLLAALLQHDYRHFAERLLDERAAAGMPPSRHMALLRAESVHRAAPAAFLERVRRRAEETGAAGIELLGPAPALMERRAGRYRAQLMLLAARRAPLHRLLAALVPGLDTLTSSGGVRWSLDVDPVDEY